jgi:cell surface protein SprA
LNCKAAHIFRTLVTTAIFFAFGFKANAFYIKETPHFSGFHFYFHPDITDTTPHPLEDRRGEPYSNPNRNTFDFRDTSYIKRTIEYDPKTKQYYIVEKVGNKYYRTPTAYSMEEFLRLQGKKDEDDYFRRRAAMLADMNRRIFKPKFKTSKDWFNRIVGTGKVDIRPTGFVDILAGYQGQNIKNPTIPERARRNGGFDFNMNAQLQVDANIGDKLKLPINYNTLANFEFENQLNLNYQGKPDEIVKQFQLGNVSFTSKGTLIPGAQSLFGIKTQLQFGKLYISGVLANQRAQRQSLGLEGGSATQTFTFRADDYEENRHFLLSQYFRNNYNTAMSQLPVVNSAVQILRVEVWVTNRNVAATTDTRDIVALMDLGESNPYNPAWGSNTDPKPHNGANNLYNTLLSDPGNRNSALVQSRLIGLGMAPVQEFEKTFARKLQASEYYFNPQIGFISLNQPLQPEEVLGIAFQYTYNGRVFQVGEFSQDVPPDTTGASQKVLFLKLLKATSQRTNLPIWDLMMKNVYSVGFGQLERQDFDLNILYEEPSLGEKRYLPPTDVIPQYQGQPLISLVNLDRLNNQNDPQQDGKFDFIEGYTVISSISRVIFPVLEPFGHGLDYVYANQATRDKYLYYPLYDTIKAIAQTYANLNRFKITGRSKTSSTGNTDYQLGFNIPRGSVTVTAGGQTLQENVDYEINYDLGTLHVTNQAIINSGVPVNIQYENQAAYGIQQKNFMGLRLDYLASKKLTLGGTMVRLGERPFFVKQSYGEDPVRNTMYGLDVDYKSNWPRLTKWLDKLPFYSTKEMSSITAYAEAAMLKPGHAPQIGKGTEGQIYIDDFEGTRSSIDLRFPLISWALASTPQLFPEATLNNDLAYGYNRAKIAWYNIEPVLQERSNTNNPLHTNLTELSKPETRQVLNKEIFPQRTNDFGQGLLTTFDVAFYPKDKGPYNYEYRPGRINPDGRLTNPKQAWGGIMRNIDQIDFETGNIEFMEFWLMDPFIKNTANPTGGQLYINLGNISEDILKDGKREYENGLPTPTNNAPVDNNTVWGRVPANPLQVTNAFSNDANDRQYQDVGLDGLSDADERTKFAAYLTNIQANAPAYAARAQNDPSGDNFKPYRDASFDNAQVGILGRYKDINNPNGNSPIASGNSQFVNAFTQYPDAEELNRDNTLNEVEEYFQYKVDIKPDMWAAPVGTYPFITDTRTVQYKPLDGSPTRTEHWYLFRIPVKEFESKVGNIPDFKSIRFIRMFVTGFDDSVVMRFGRLELVRNQWRKFQYGIDTTGQYVNLPANSPTVFNTLAVNIEENDQREPIPYKIPPGIERQQQLSNNNVELFLNEQSLSMQVCDLQQGQARGVFKNLNMDFRQYGKLMMFIHAEGRTSNDFIKDNSLAAVIRIGNDFQGNFYEIKIPLKRTNWGDTVNTKVWPEVNNLDFDLDELTKLKDRRDKIPGQLPSQYYREIFPNGRSYGIIGNPNLGEVKGILLAVQNQNIEPACAEVWFNELRLSHLDEKGGVAALARMDVKLADLGGINLSGTIKTQGFGTLEQRVNERSRENIYTFDASTNIDAGKLLPKGFRLQIPVFAGISRIGSTPQYDPYALDIKFKQKLDDAKSKLEKDSMRNVAQNVTTIKTLNFTNVKKLRADGKRPKLWSISNIDLNYSYTITQHHDPLIENDELRRTRAALGYAYTMQPKYIEPFKKLIRSKSKWFTFIKDINFNFIPTQISFKADVFRQFGATRLRNVGGGPYKIPETYNKYFTFDRYYILQWNLARSISVDFSAINNARIDEPYGRIDTKDKKDSVRTNFFKGGRNTHYHQQATITYNVPTQKIPLLDWTTIRASYATQYDWLAASLLARNLGNTLSNSQTKTINGEFNFDQLYNKSRFLRAVNMPSQSGSGGDKSDKNAKGKDDKNKSGDKNKPADKNVKAPPVRADKEVARKPWEISPDSLAKMTPKQKRLAKKAMRKKRREERRLQRQQKNSAPMEVNSAVKFVAGLATSLKRVGIQYNEDLGTTLPDYLDSTQVLGSDLRSGNPGFDFIFGRQPDTNWINKFGAKGLLSKDPLVSAMIQQRFNQRLNITAQLTPFRDFNIDVNFDKSFSKNYSELYKDTTGTAGLTRLSPYTAGSFSISYISYQTLFNKFDPNVVSETFKKFEANRQILSQRLGPKNPYQSGVIDANGYYDGYGRYAQDVVIPAFLAAYTDKDPMSVSLIKSSNPQLKSNPFSGLIPKPNWSITYNGLSKIPGLDKIFTNVSIRHGYHSTLSMNSFNSALLFRDPFHEGFPEFIDTTAGERRFVPYFLVPNVTIQEQFDPLLEVDMTFTNELSTRIEFKKSRTLSLSLIDYQLAENRSTEVTFGFNWRKKGMPIIKKIGKMKLDNDVTFRFDFSLRDDATANSKLDQKTSFGTAGQKVIRIAPSIDYILNKRVSLKMYFEQNRNIPKISNAFPITNTRGGLQVRISLAQ